MVKKRQELVNVVCELPLIVSLWNNKCDFKNNLDPLSSGGIYCRLSSRIVALFIALIIVAWWGSHLKFFFPEVANNYVAQFEAVKKPYILPTICLKTTPKVSREHSYQIFRENKEFSHCLKIANCISRVTET